MRSPAMGPLQTFLLFLLAGPLIGFAFFILPPTALALERGEVGELVSASYLRSVGFYLAGAYVVGALPAGLTGLVFTFSNTTWRLPTWARCALAGALGAAISGLLSVITTGSVGLLPLAASVSAISGAVCGWLSPRRRA